MTASLQTEVPSKKSSEVKPANRINMTAFYKIDKRRGLVLSSGSGVLTRADLVKHMEQLLNDPDFDPKFSQLADFSEVSGFDLTGDDVRELANKTVFSPQSRRAFIASGDLAFGLARMFETLRDLKGEFGICVFREKEDALNWVLGKGKGA